MRIAEIFYSIQGEGILAGMPSIFVRTSGCNLRCWYCDTPYTSWQPEGSDLSVAEIMDRIRAYSTKYVVVTGGEPVLAAGIEELCQQLRERGYHITLETAATVFKPIPCDLASLSPKLASSAPREEGKLALHHHELRLQIPVIQALMEHSDAYQLKFVVDQPADLKEIESILSQLPAIPLDRVLLMPQGVDSEALRERGVWIAEACKARGYRFCPRLHIELYGHQRGT